MSTVFIPAVLRPSVAGAKSLELAGSTVGELVHALLERHPGLGGQLLTPDGELNRFVNVYVNGQDVRYLEVSPRPWPIAMKSGSSRRWQAAEVAALRAPGTSGTSGTVVNPPQRGPAHEQAHTDLAPHGGRYENILDAIGHTPLVAIPPMSPNPAVHIYAKLEFLNPSGSVKDRPRGH